MLLSRPRLLTASACVVVLAACFTACSVLDLSGVKTTCAGVGYFALDVTVRDQFGQAQAVGATVTLTDGSYAETDVGGDTLHIFAADERGGRTCDIRVSKRYYNDAVIRNVKTRGGGCVTDPSQVTLTVPVTLTLEPGAPPLRAMQFKPGFALLDRPPYQTAFNPRLVFDANPEVSRAVTWSIAGDTLSVSFNRATGVVTYHCGPRSDSVTVTARSVVDTSLVARQVVRFQGHPATESDPPC